MTSLGAKAAMSHLPCFEGPLESRVKKALGADNTYA
jgi:hypothetical protein